jgi:hypothetical protein
MVRQTDRQTNNLTSRETPIQTDRRIDGQTDIETNIQIDRQTGTHQQKREKKMNITIDR